MKLSELADKITNDFEVSKLCLDSRKCKENSVFFAINGSALNGEDFIDSAISNGARAIVVDCNSQVQVSENIELIKSENIQQILADYCERFYSNIPENIVAVTGTNGKTSVACFFAQIVAKLGKKSASLGTFGALLDGDYDKNINESGLTTPDVITLYETLSELKRKGVEYVCIEASSHGLVQGRLGNLKFKSAGFLNLTQDHLDYHHTMEEYFAAKELLFIDHLGSDGIAIFNTDIDEFKHLKKIKDNYIDYGRDNNNSIAITNITLTNFGLQIEINHNIIKTHLIGEFQAYNLACAIGLIFSVGFDLQSIVEACEGITSVRGRMEIIEIPRQGAKAVIDYAHTPDALDKAIMSLKPHTSGRIITVFGCGGDRDKTKRPLMGEVAEENSDIAILTDDNPRTENAKSIRADVKTACPNAIEIGGRKEAIIYGLKMLQEGDSLLVAGKGHEDYQVIGDKKIHFDDSEVIKEYLNSK